MTKYLFSLRPTVPLIRPWKYLSKTVMLAWKSGPFHGPKHISSRATFDPRAMGCTPLF